MSEPLQEAMTLDEALVAMDPLSKRFCRVEEAFTLRRGWGFEASSVREGRRGNGN
ncbi:MAG: hypothetical protein AVDCRST_MAG78-245 [uncultured Rubrobacteraceae bacterium]|uniref:Uncharacterized protein n=1 Tax=uncultured Rubrobacteraceae bacterium TaxID=349277 RepID=A0A6J4P7V7_9ACTN|nr:MAG: hypothetical protein AVDCRST_MAG78-245 [uncultured Rubrobacteraceae bacterium]